MNAFLVLGNQLFSPSFIRKATQADEDSTMVFMREDVELCTYFKFHKQKIVFFLGAMRAYAEELRTAGFKVEYQALDSPRHASSQDSHSESYEHHLAAWIKTKKIKQIRFFEIEDKFFETRILATIETLKIEHEVLRSPMFLTSRTEFESYLKKNKRPFMKTFYEGQRKRLKILVTESLEPVGGRWSFDEDNRLPLPLKVTPPPVALEIAETKILSDVRQLTESKFSSHPGSLADTWLPIDRVGATAWLDRFLTERLHDFGTYEDAIPSHSEFVFHSVLTPFLNTGLLTPSEVIRQALKIGRDKKVPMNSLEGFVRQIIGWREFVRGIYQNFSSRQDTSNFWGHTKKLKPCWYDATTGVPPLDKALEKTIRYGYAHHIERLMVIGSLMLLLEVEPTEAHRWFMEMFIDSSDWVMGPNVYGMALFSDGGIFATKPYICGSNYYRKMGGYKTGDWCDGVDGLYWSFIEKHKTFFLKNPRLSMMARTVEKMDPEKKKRIFSAADTLRAKLVTASKVDP